MTDELRLVRLVGEAADRFVHATVRTRAELERTPLDVERKVKRVQLAERPIDGALQPGHVTVVSDLFGDGRQVAMVSPHAVT